MDFIQRSITELFDTAKKKRLSMRKACAQAGIHPTTVSRWKHGQSPKMHEFNELWKAVNDYKPEKGKKV